jgi:hypothetical protein
MLRAAYLGQKMFGKRDTSVHNLPMFPFLPLAEHRSLPTVAI